MGLETVLFISFGFLIIVYVLLMLHAILDEVVKNKSQVAQIRQELDQLSRRLSPSDFVMNIPVATFVEEIATPTNDEVPVAQTSAALSN